jgi:glycosyltransferase involved in cell wall biosynthesis
MTTRSPLRVAILAPPYYEVPPTGYGGIELVCGFLADGLVDAGHDVVVIGAGCRRTRARFVPTFAEPQPEATEDATRIEVQHAARALEIVRAEHVDVVHDHTRLGPLTAPLRPAPTVLTVHGPLTGQESGRVELEAVQNWVQPVAISATQRAHAPDVPWAATIPHGLALDRYPFRSDKEDFVLYLGRINPAKGVEVAIATARAAGRHLVLAGSWTTPTERAYFHEAVAPELGSGVEWVGEVGMAAKVDLLGRAACLLFPIQWEEPFGLVAIEAAACGTPVVALRAGAVVELIADRETGVLCATPDELPAAVDVACALDPARARARAQRHFDARLMTSRYESLYAELAGQRHPSR